MSVCATVIGGGMGFCPYIALGVLPMSNIVSGLRVKMH